MEWKCNKCGCRIKIDTRKKTIDIVHEYGSGKFICDECIKKIREVTGVDST